MAGLVGDRVPVGVCAGLLVVGAVAANLGGLRGATWIAGALAPGFRAFVGIGGTTGLAEETRHPRRAMRLGLLLGLGALLVTTVVLGAGVVGTPPREDWVGIVSADRANAPHLAVGEAMLGAPGHDVTGDVRPRRAGWRRGCARHRRRSWPTSRC